MKLTTPLSYWGRLRKYRFFWITCDKWIGSLVPLNHVWQTELLLFISSTAQSNRTALCHSKRVRFLFESFQGWKTRISRASKELWELFCLRCRRELARLMLLQNFIVHRYFTQELLVLQGTTKSTRKKSQCYNISVVLRPIQVFAAYKQWKYYLSFPLGSVKRFLLSYLMLKLNLFTYIKITQSIFILSFFFHPYIRRVL